MTKSTLLFKRHFWQRRYKVSEDQRARKPSRSSSGKVAGENALEGIGFEDVVFLVQGRIGTWIGERPERFQVFPFMFAC